MHSFESLTPSTWYTHLEYLAHSRAQTGSSLAKARRRATASRRHGTQRYLDSFCRHRLSFRVNNAPSFCRSQALYLVYFFGGLGVICLVGGFLVTKLRPYHGAKLSSLLMPLLACFDFSGDVLFLYDLVVRSG